MKKPLDRVTEAYFDEMGSDFGEKVRERVHWICEQAKGENILEVGCSQGITSILLAREGKRVLGLDILEESIDFAKELRAGEPDSIKEFIDFKTANYINYEFNDNKFDSIIFGEVLEHITDPNRFMKKAEKLLNDNGQIVVTVPFGINDYFDHKKTYYIKDLIDFQNENLSISSVEFFGKWVGVVYKNINVPSNIEINSSNLLSRLEQAFLNVERNLLNENRELKKLNDTIDYTQSEGNNLKKELADLEAKNKSLELEKDKMKKKYNKVSKQLEEKNKQVIIEKKNKLEVDKLLLEAYNKEEKLLKAHSKLLARYDALKSSKLGRVTLKYWRWRKRNSGVNNK